MEFAKLSAPSLKDLFVQQLQGMILSDELPMGTQLPPERELAQQMQVSRAVVNGGLAELAQQQLPKLRGCDAHFTVILSEVDENLLRRLGINVSCEAGTRRRSCITNEMTCAFG